MHFIIRRLINSLILSKSPRNRFYPRGPGAADAAARAPFDWRSLAPRAAAEGLDVIMPIHGGMEETLTAIHSVLAAATRLAYRLIVIDDASPEPGLSAAVAELAARGLIHLEVNPENLGFAGAVNRGLALGRGDVILLNSDTEVFDFWLDRLTATARAADDIATVTPLSNAATILSYPKTLSDNPEPLELSPRALDALAAGLPPATVNLPTAVGFCMYLRRACLDQIGPLDAAAFPQGYGEENDFCLRATAAGWRHAAATHVFVRHIGARSFGARRAALVAEGLATLDARYPHYRAEVAAFIAADPLGPARLALDLARIRAAAGPGVDRHRLGMANSDYLRLERPRDRRSPLRLACAGAPNLPNLPQLDPLEAPRAAAELLGQLEIRSLALDEKTLGRARFTAFEALAAAEGMAWDPPRHRPARAALLAPALGAPGR